MRLYRDKVFRQWQPTLEKVSRQYGLPRAERIWNAAGQAMCRLKEYDADVRDVAIESIYSDLSASTAFERPELAATEIMAVMYSQLCDAIPEGMAPNHPHAPLCVAVAKSMHGNLFFERLLDDFVSRPTDNWGNKVVLPVEDYLEEAQPPGHNEAALRQPSGPTAEDLYQQAISLPTLADAYQLQLALCKCGRIDLSDKVTEFFRHQEQAKATTFIATNNGPVNGDIKRQSIGIPSPTALLSNKALSWPNNNQALE